MTQDEDETLALLQEVTGQGEEITLSDLLGDAAQCLKEHGKPALAKAARMAQEMVGEGPKAEAWIKDVYEVINEAQDVILNARRNPNEVDLSKLAQAVTAAENWGLSPISRTEAAYPLLVHEIFTTIVELEAGRHATAKARLHSLVSRLGFDDE